MAKCVQLWRLNVSRRYLSWLLFWPLGHSQWLFWMYESVWWIFCCSFVFIIIMLKTFRTILLLIESLICIRPFPFLRVRTFLHQTFQVYHVYCNFILGYICRIAVNVGTMKDRSLLINIFASNIWFSDRNIFQNGADALLKIDDAFLTKSLTFHLVLIIRLCSNFACSINTYYGISNGISDFRCQHLQW